MEGSITMTLLLPEFDKQVIRAWSACRASGLAGDPTDVSIHLLRYGVDVGPIVVSMKLEELRVRGRLPSEACRVA